MTCTFFGHRNTPDGAEVPLRKVIAALIEHHGADIFYVGHQGKFDYMVRRVLKEVKRIYPHITYFVVLAYMPGVRNVVDMTDYSDTIYPDGLENTPPKFAVVKRNRWLVEHSDTVITYVDHTSGGAAQFKELAEKKGKWVINLAN